MTTGAIRMGDTHPYPRPGQERAEEHGVRRDEEEQERAREEGVPGRAAQARGWLRPVYAMCAYTTYTHPYTHGQHLRCKGRIG